MGRQIFFFLTVQAKFYFLKCKERKEVGMTLRLPG